MMWCSYIIFIGQISCKRYYALNKTKSFYMLYIDLLIGRCNYHPLYRGRHGRDRMVVGFITTYEISAYHH